MAKQSASENTVEAIAKTQRRFSIKRLLTVVLLSLISGFVASLMAVLLMGILRLAAGVPTPVELFGDFVLKHISVDTFLRLLLTFGPNAKKTPLLFALLGMIGLGTVSGVLYAVLARVPWPAQGYRPGRREWMIGAIFALVMAAVGTVLFWNELRQNFFGLTINWAITVTILALLADFGLYGLTLCLAYRALLPKQARENSSAVAEGRRQLLARAGVAAVTVGAGGGIIGLVNGFLSNYASYDGMFTVTHNGHTGPITPNSEHYVVTQNPIDPTPSTAVWRLEVTGLVGNAGTYSYEDLQNVPSISRAVTLECIANGIYVGGRLISTAVWQGITLRSLLARQGGAQSNATHVAFYSVDGYNNSLPLNEVLEADALIVWRMNGEELPVRHGFPVRALIPGRYGEEQPKWLTRIELTDHFVGGLYSDQGWYYGSLHTMNRIDRPSGQVATGQPVEVAGFAFAGNRGIKKVEVSADNGITWNVATLAAPLSKDSWVFWSWQWTPMAAGNTVLAARATDGTGVVQTSKKQGTVPNGATGYHEVMIQVK